MKVSPHQEKFLEQISDQGIEFFTSHWAIGEFSLAAKQIEPFTEDADLFAANSFGVTKEHLLEWGVFQKSQQCLGQTGSAVRCKGRADKAFRVTTPSQYSASNPDCYCSKHKHQALDKL